jgi:hypothetical protein
MEIDLKTLLLNPLKTKKKKGKVIEMSPEEYFLKGFISPKVITPVFITKHI